MKSKDVRDLSCFKAEQEHPERKPEIIVNKELSHTILGVDVCKFPYRIISIFKIN
jgi:hypothetical protein